MRGQGLAQLFALPLLRLKKRLRDIGHGCDVNAERSRGNQTGLPIHMHILQGQNLKMLQYLFMCSRCGPNWLLLYSNCTR